MAPPSSVNCHQRLIIFINDDYRFLNIIGTKSNSISGDDKKAQNKYEEVMGSLLYECASHEKLDLLSFWISAFQLQWQINRPGYCFVGSQLALITTMSKMEQTLICSEIIASILQSLKSR